MAGIDLMRRKLMAGGGLAAAGLLPFVGVANAMDLATKTSGSRASGRSGAASMKTGGERLLPKEVGVGRKFAATGQVQRWPGCTLLCHIPRPGQAFDVLCEARDMLRGPLVFRRKLTWLPEHSFHVTICDLLNESHRQASDWPAGIPLDAPLEHAYAHIGRALRNLKMDGPAPIRFVMDAASVQSGMLRTGIPWVPANAAEERRLRELRNRVFDAVGIRHEGHDGYAFHTTLAYTIDALSEHETSAWRRLFEQAMKRVQVRLPVLELGAPEFCLFSSMYFFEPQFSLQTSSPARG